MRTLLRAVLGCTVIAGAVLAAAPAHAEIVCTTDPTTGPAICRDNGAGGVAPAPYVPPAANVPPPAKSAPYAALRAPAQQTPAYFAPAPAQAQVNVPPAPAPSPNRPRKGVAPTENPVIAGVPAEAPSATATPTKSSADTAPTPTASAPSTPSPSAAPAEPIQSEQAASTMSPAPFIVGVLALLVIGAAAWQWRRTRKAKAD